MPNLHLHGIVYATLGAFCWGTALVMSKGVLTTFAPIPLLLIQLLSSVIFVWCVIFFKKIQCDGVKKLKTISLLGLLEPFLTYILVLIGLSYARASDAALLQSVESVFIVLLAALFFKEKISPLFICLSLVIFIGLYFSLDSSLQSILTGAFTGNTLIIAGMLVAAIYVVLTSRTLATIDAIVVVACQQTVALLATAVVFFIQSNAIFPLPALSMVMLAIISGIFQYGLAFTCYLNALKHISAGLAGMFLNLVPIFGIIGAGLFLDEKMTLIQIAGAIVTLCALFMISILSEKKSNV